MPIFALTNLKSNIPMKATLYTETEQAVEPIDEHKLAVATEKPNKVEPPRQSYYLVDYKTLVKPTLIALAILAVWVVLTVVL